MDTKIAIPDSFRVRLTRLASTNTNLRTPTVQGICPALPQIGKSFLLYSESLTDPGNGFRMVEISAVTAVSEPVDGVTTFTTRNSSYSLEILPDEEEE